jgi:SAM-dependent methyltransferase
MPEGQEYWDGVAPRYGALYANDWSLFENSLVKEDLRRLLQRAVGKRILDVGFGTGLGYELLGGDTSDIDYVGVDVSGAMLLEFQKKHPAVRTVQASGDALTTSLSMCRFDVVISINVAASFPADTQLMLRDLFRILVPGGLIYLSFLNRYSLRRLIHGKFGHAEKYRTRGDHESRHFAWGKTYSRRELVRMSLGAGFNNVGCSYRSVLGGVWESAAAVRAERLLAEVVPWLGHATIITGTRDDEAITHGEMEAVLRT